jgi:hypothetical protein
MANVTIDQLPSASTIDATSDLLPIYTASTTATQSISRNTLLGLASAPVGLTDSQTVKNKTIDNSNTIAVKAANLSIEDGTDTTKVAKFVASGITTGTTRSYTLPDITDTLVTLTATQTLTNKTLTSPTINSPTITNATITADTLSGYTTSNSGTIYGISVTSGKISSNLAATGTLTVTGATTLSSTLATTGQPSFQTGTSIPSAGASTAGILLSSTANFGIFYGSGAPTFSAAKGSIYLRSDGSSTSTRLYVNSSGSTTWTNFTSAA